jgi:hypothetical protein
VKRIVRTRPGRHGRKAKAPGGFGARGVGPDSFLAIPHTGKKLGTVTSVEVDSITVEYYGGLKKADFSGVIEVDGPRGEPFAEPGDSGSLVVDQDGKALGLVFAGSQKGSSKNRSKAYVIPIKPVLDELGLELAR